MDEPAEEISPLDVGHAVGLFDGSETFGYLKRQSPMRASPVVVLHIDPKDAIEMHGRFSPETAAQVAAAIEPYAPRWIEEPVPPENAAALARVRRATNTSIATGERIHSIWDAAPFIEGGDVDIVQADITHFGGFTGMRRLAGWTEAHYLTLAPHNVGGPVATAANVHFAVATRNVDIVEHFNDFADAWVSELVDAAPTVDPADGCFAVPERPGLSVRLDHDACARHPRTGARLQLFVEGWQRRDGG